MTIARRWLTTATDIVTGAPLLARALLSDRHARSHHGPGLEFASFGRSLGLKLLPVEPSLAREMLLWPVSIVRYWEFPFAARHLPVDPVRCLDVASPRLFSYYVASRVRPGVIRIINPDERDARLTAAIAKRAGLGQITVEALPVSAIAPEQDTYDAIWSISVLEHIPGDGDTEAVRVLWKALRPGGRLIITVPVDRTAWDEFRSTDIYGLGVPADERGHFFQRWYDRNAVADRLLLPIDQPPAHIEWFGEAQAGTFAAYEQDWLHRGLSRVVDDPREIADHYREFTSWEEMPGQGVAGFVVEKPDPGRVG
jgi:SAM-dependent methyltransferase